MDSSCSGCDAEWPSSPATSHCSACHLTFSSTGTFDQHRRGKVGARYCRPPWLAGLVLDDRGRWGTGVADDRFAT
jgi:hypothetical protein